MSNNFSQFPLVDIVAPSVLTIGLTLISGITTASVEASTLVSGFEGVSAPANFTLTNQNADGFVNFADAPDSITLTGGDNSSGSFGSTSFTTSAPADGMVSFDYDYNSFNIDGPLFDPFGVVINGTFTQISDDNGPDNQTGDFSFDVDGGDVFGFSIQTVDNILGPASVTISSFEAPASVPEPATVLALLAVSSLGLMVKRKDVAK